MFDDGAVVYMDTTQKQMTTLISALSTSHFARRAWTVYMARVGAYYTKYKATVWKMVVKMAQKSASE